MLSTWKQYLYVSSASDSVDRKFYVDRLGRTSSSLLFTARIAARLPRGCVPPIIRESPWPKLERSAPGLPRGALIANRDVPAPSELSDEGSLPLHNFRTTHWENQLELRGRRIKKKAEQMTITHESLRIIFHASPADLLSLIISFGCWSWGRISSSSTV